jgi:UDP-N-acetylglucosamine 3-dehydrogenase
MVRFAILGCGAIARNRHIPSCLACDGAALAGFYNRSGRSAEQLAEKYGAKYYATVEQALEDEAVDAVIICTATKTHSGLAIAALRAGKHVLCEKPMAATAVEAKAMVEVSRETGKKLMVSHNQRRYLPHRKALELIRAGEIGKVLTFRTALGITGPEYSSLNRSANNWYFDKQAAGRGVVSDVGSHRVDLMCQFFGRPRRVFAYTPTLDKRYSDGRLIDLDDNAFAIMEFESGVVGSLITSWTSYNGNDRTTQIFGSDGVLTIYTEREDLFLEKRGAERVSYTLPESGPQSSILLTDIVEQFVRCIEEDTQPIVTGEDGLLVIRVIEAMVESNRRGTWVLLNEIPE